MTLRRALSFGSTTESLPGWRRREAGRLLGRRYPGFVYARDPDEVGSDYLPVFTFHTLEPADFEGKLRYLSDNGYRTLSLDRVLAHIEGQERAPPRSVALTIDDGRLSTWSVGLPLLSRYGMKATAFVIPGYLGDGAPRSTVSTDASSSGPEASVSESRDRQTFLRWSEVRELHRSRHVSIESHTMLHRRVTVSRELVGFLRPDMDVPRFDIPLPPNRRDGWTSADLRERLGAPIYGHDAVLGTGRALRVPDAAVDRCTALVRREGDEEFFRSRGWRRRLDREVETVQDREFEPYDTEDLQRDELRRARSALEDRLEGKQVRHLCLPSGRSSERAVRLAEEVGYRSALEGLVKNGDPNRPGSDPMAVERLKHDFIYRLPGDGRRSLVELIIRKSLRRLRGDTGH